MVNALAGPSCVEVLRKQELSREYQCRDYLRGEHAVTPATRGVMLDWVQQITSFVKLSDDIPILTATLLDRFLQTPEGQHILLSVPEYRLATMGCLYLTVKLHEPVVVIGAETMSQFSHGMFSAKQVERMELLILKAMNWHVHPPTALAFVREFLLLLPCSVPAAVKEQAHDLCHVQIQRSILDYPVFASTEPSTIAFFALQNALSSLGMDSITLGHVAAIFSYSVHIDYFSRPNQEIALQTCLLGRAEIGNLNHGSHHRDDLRRFRSKRPARCPSESPSTSSTWSRQSLNRRRSCSFDESPNGVVSLYGRKWHTTR